ncbi:PR-1-like protein [Trichoderma citrinoviride]|uniref:PR-1-like protein n=1 Tax=Trichoderma citrinoviride TaxID=58853 RepID=A0A2T4B5Y9_9HYPO|nr:PR-1-like protein [Trichoderma citrinoviride]PTB64744.1 PR-1-like protein [Trichoderma citrinoviride]
MKSAVLLAAGALLASAVPLEKRVMETDWVTDIVTVTVTVDPAASASATPTAGGPSPPPAPASSPKPAPSPQPVVAKPSPAPSPKPVTSPKPAPSSAPAPAPAPAPSSAPASGNDYGSIMVNQHNVHRANHSSPALEWDDTLAGYAQKTAQGCVFAHDMTEGGGGYGQNLASWGSTGNIDDKQIEAARRGVTDQWYNDEMENWTFFGLANPPSGSNLDSWGHFTQLVWKSSTKVGCYTAKCPAGTVLSMQSWYTVCNYSPPGNFGGRYAENVLKPLGQPTVRI